jgi:hypothetical protein
MRSASSGTPTIRERRSYGDQRSSVAGLQHFDKDGQVITEGRNAARGATTSRSSAAFACGQTRLRIKLHSVKLHPVVYEAEAEAVGDLALQSLEFRIDEFDDFAGFDIDHVIVVRFGGCFVTRAAVAEIVPVEDPCFLEQPDGAVDRCNRDARVDRCRTGMEPFDIGVVLAVGEHPCDDAPLLGDTQAALSAKSF